MRISMKIFIILLFWGVIQGFLRPSIKNREIRVTLIVKEEHVQPLFDPEVEREKLNQLSPESLTKLAGKSFSQTSSHPLSAIELEEVKDQLLHEKLSQLSRKQIIDIAKLYYQGDLRKPTSFLCEQIIEETRKLKSKSRFSPSSSQIPSNPLESISLDEEEQEVLKEQGLDFEDLLKLQVQFQQQGPTYFLKEKTHVSRKRFTSNAEKKNASSTAHDNHSNSSNNRRLGPKDTAAARRRQQLVQAIFYNDSLPSFSRSSSSSSITPTREPLVISDSQLEKLPRRRKSNNKDIPNLGQLLTAPPKDILEGVTLQRMIEELVQKCGYQRLFHETHLRFLQNHPSVSSLVTALRAPKMDWARQKIERFYVRIKLEERRASTS